MELERTIMENADLKECLEKSKHSASDLDQEKNKLNEQIKTVEILQILLKIII